MKNYKTLIPFILLLLLISCKKEKEQHLILNLQPDASIGKDATIWTSGNNPYYIPHYQQKNLGSDPRLLAHSWTNSGYPDTSRFLIEFDLSSIPEYANIDSARLSLFNNYNTESFYGEHQGENASFIQRITTSWDENSVTWDSKPNTTTVNQITLDNTSEKHQNFEDIDVTVLVKDILADPENSFGFLIKLQSEETYKALVFASSDHEDEGIRPKLEIFYTIME